MDIEAQFPLEDSFAFPLEAFAPEEPAFTPPEPDLPPAQDLDYAIRDWDEEEIERLGRRLQSQVDAYMQATEQRRHNLQDWRDDWELLPTDDAAAEAGSADIPSEGTRVECDNHTVRLNQQIVNPSPPVTVAAKEEAALAAVTQIEEALSAVLEEAGWAAAADQVHSLLPRDGNAFLRTMYEVETRMVPVVQVETDDAGQQALVEAGVPLEQAMYSALKTDRQGRPRRKVVLQEQVHYQGVRFKAIPWEDGIILPATARSWEQAYGIGEWFMLSGAELRAGAESGRYRKEAVDDLLRFDGDEPDDYRQEILDAQGLEAQLPPVEGYGEDDEAKLYAEYRCCDLCYKVYDKKAKRLVWAWVTLHHDSAKVLRFQYLPWEHGEPHYVMFPYFPRPGELFGQGVAELAAVYQDAETAWQNTVINYGEIATHLGGLVWADRNAGLKPDRTEVRLGQINVCEDTQSIKFLQPPPLPTEYFNLGAILREKRERLTRTSNVSLGRETQGQKTLGEIQLVTASGNLQFEDAGARVARVWAKVFDHVRLLVAQYGDGGAVSYRRTARPAVQIPGAEASMSGDQEAAGGPPAVVEFQTIDRDTLRMKVDLIPTGLGVLADLQSRLQQAQMTFNTLMALPAVQMNPQVQLLLIEYYLEQLKVPIRDKLMQSLAAAFGQQLLAQQQAAQAQMAAEEAAVAEQDAQGRSQEAGLEARIMAEAMDQGLMPAPGEGAPLGPAGPMTAAGVPGNGAAPAGVL